MCVCKRTVRGPAYLDTLYPEAQSVCGAESLSPLHVAGLGDCPLLGFLGGWGLWVHLQHLLIQVPP